MSDVSLKVSLSLSQELGLELSLNVDQNAVQHWDQRILQGIVPLKIEHEGDIDFSQYALEMEKLANFEVEIVADLLQKEWKTTQATTARSTLHYFGIGTAQALEGVTLLANCKNYDVVAYDISDVGCANGRKVFEVPGRIHNTVYQADIEFACEKKFLHTSDNDKLVASRVLNILDSQEPNWRRKKPSRRKMARTAKRIGKMLGFLDVLLIQPENDPNALWHDTTPHSLEEIAGYMRDGFGGEVRFDILGTHQFYNHTYTAVLFRSLLSP